MLSLVVCDQETRTNKFQTQTGKLGALGKSLQANKKAQFA